MVFGSSDLKWNSLNTHSSFCRSPATVPFNHRYRNIPKTSDRVIWTILKLKIVFEINLHREHIFCILKTQFEVTTGICVYQFETRHTHSSMLAPILPLTFAIQIAFVKSSICSSYRSGRQLFFTRTRFRYKFDHSFGKIRAAVFNFPWCGLQVKCHSKVKRIWLDD